MGIIACLDDYHRNITIIYNVQVEGNLWCRHLRDHVGESTDH